MGVGVEALFTSALGLQVPWVVEDVKLNIAGLRVDFKIASRGELLAYMACGAALQRVIDWLCRSWRHLVLFLFEAWLHRDVPRVACSGCGKLQLRRDHAGAGDVCAPGLGLGLEDPLRGADPGALPRTAESTGCKPAALRR